MGSPQMNFLDGVVEEKNGKVVVNIAGTRISISEENAKKLKDQGYVGKDVTVGIRPENISDAPEDIAANPESTVDAKIAVRENLGAEVYLYTDYAGNQITARVHPDSKAQVGETVKVVLDPSKLHVFDKDTEVTVF